MGTTNNLKPPSVKRSSPDMSPEERFIPMRSEPDVKEVGSSCVVEPRMVYSLVKPFTVTVGSPSLFTYSSRWHSKSS